MELVSRVSQIFVLSEAGMESLGTFFWDPDRSVSGFVITMVWNRSEDIETKRMCERRVFFESVREGGGLAWGLDNNAAVVAEDWNE